MIVSAWCSICSVMMVLIVEGTQGARILAMFPMPVKSHMIVSSALTKELANRGHQVTVFSPFPEQSTIPNYKDIEFKITYPEIKKESSDTSNMFKAEEWSDFQIIKMLWDAGTELCDRMFQEEFIQKLIHSDEERFDVLIVGAFFNDCVLAIAHKLKIPIIQLCSFGGTKWMTDSIGNPSPYSYVPSPLLDLTDTMDFWQRMRNTISELYTNIGRRFYFLPKQDAIVRKFFDDSMPSISELESSTSLVLLNSHFSIGYPRPLLPNAILVAGIHMKTPKKLPQDIEKYINESTDGVIFFSMGSNLKSSNMPKTHARAFIEAFAKLKQRVIWKWEDESLPGKSDNVMVRKWLPQSDILGHPNVRLFMTHGGLMSTEETIHRGVPIIGMPIYGDQRINMARAVSAGIGVRLNFRNNITTESVTWALKEVLDNPRYREKAQQLSRIFRDQPLSPLEQAVFWTEYVIRHKGAPHMRSAALDLTWYQYFLLDVIAVLVIAIGSLIFLLTFIFRLAIRKLFYGRLKTDISAAGKKKN